MVTTACAWLTFLACPVKTHFHSWVLLRLVGFRLAAPSSSLQRRDLNSAVPDPAVPGR